MSGYNGWTNWETWTVNLTYGDTIDQDMEHANIESEEELMSWLADMVWQDIEENLGNGLAAEFARAGYEEINFYELAEAYEEHIKARCEECNYKYDPAELDEQGLCEDCQTEPDSCIYCGNTEETHELRLDDDEDWVCQECAEEG